MSVENVTAREEKAEVDMTSMGITLGFVRVDSTTGEPVGTAGEIPLFLGVRSVPHVGHTIVLGFGVYRVRQVVWHFPDDQQDADRVSGQLVHVYIYKEGSA